VHNVRCCSDSNLENWTQHAGCDIWTETDIDGCQSLPFDLALAHCVKLGGRLCTVSELESNCAYGTGCGYDATMVWSISTLDDDSKHYVIKGADMVSCNIDDCSTQLVHDSQEYPVQCCADYSIDGWQNNGGTQCKNLVWTNRNRWNENTWRECLTLNWNDAKLFCEEQGGRLCTETEFTNRCTEGAPGCNYDRVVVWSAEEEDKTQNCILKQGKKYDPIDENIPLSMERNAEFCRDRCLATELCIGISYWSSGVCRLFESGATLVADNLRTSYDCTAVSTAVGDNGQSETKVSATLNAATVSARNTFQKGSALVIFWGMIGAIYFFNKQNKEKHVSYEILAAENSESI